MGLQELGLQTHGFAVLLDRLFQPAQMFQAIAVVQTVTCVARFSLGQLGIGRHRIGIAAQSQQVLGQGQCQSQLTGVGVQPGTQSGLDLCQPPL